MGATMSAPWPAAIWQPGSFPFRRASGREEIFAIHNGQWRPVADSRDQDDLSARQEHSSRLARAQVAGRPWRLQLVLARHRAHRGGALRGAHSLGWGSLASSEEGRSFHSEPVSAAGAPANLKSEYFFLHSSSAFSSFSFAFSSGAR